ncbi:MAG: penicillin acylase family protein, partial [Gemmatimonadetes bacterium]|nr:penicillin acylase family protein [Gemmatimonadota bacterium]
MVRKPLKLVLLLAILLLAAGYFTVVRLRSGPELRSRTLSLEGLGQPVEILYDSMGVPHLFASSMEDLFLAQGYVHATHRLWQMEMFRRVLQGRLSEVFGGRTLETDRFLRTVGMEKAARDGLPDRASPTYRYMERYAEGVNAAIQGWRGPLPPEFVLLRLRPEPWDPVLAQGIEKIMAWDLSDYDTGLDLAAARMLRGDSALALLMPRYPSWGPTFVDGRRDPGALPGPADTAAGARALPPPVPPELLAQAALPEGTQRILELGSAVRASNSWVVGGERSRSGKPLVANDMHLALNAPNIWFLIGL